MAVAIFIGLSGGSQSPYYLYALSPLIAAGFFFQLRGAIWATTLFLPLYTAVILFSSQQSNDPIEWLSVIINITGFYLISSAFGYAAVSIGMMQTRLRRAKETAQSTRQELRRTIHDLWAEEITPEAFESELKQYATDVLQANNLLLQFDIRGSFSTLSPRARRSLYRIAQECLTNIVHHAAATESRVCVDVENGRARLVVRDNGRGFEPDIALAQEHGQEHFGLRGMQNRARILGGTCDIFSQPEAGSSIVIDIPAADHATNVAE